MSYARLVALIALACSGCANVTSVTPLAGGNTYQIESHHGSDTAVARGIVAKAMETCPDGYLVVQQQFDGNSMIIQCKHPRAD